MTPHVPVIKNVLATSSRFSVINSHSTTVSGQNGTINLSVDLGLVQVKPTPVVVERAPNGASFSVAEWPTFAANTPDGLTIVSSRKEGTPEYPILTVTLAVPESAHDLLADLTPITQTPLGRVTLPPIATSIGDSSSRRVYDASAYVKSWQSAATVSAPRTFRTVRTVIVQFPLLSSKAGQLTALQKFKLTLRFKFNGVLQNAPIKDPVFAPINSHIAANAWDVGRFSVPFVRARSTTFPSVASTQSGALGGFGEESYNWIDQSAKYVKLTVTRDGLYRILPSDLTTAGVNFDLAQNQFTARNLRCFNHGKEVRIWVDSDANGNITGIEFYGEHLAGFPLPTAPSANERPVPEYYNIYTDKNVYWLTNSSVHTSAPPRRYTARSPAKSGSTPVVVSGGVALHHERDYFYHNGSDGSSDETRTKQQTQYYDGERYEWFEMHGPNVDPQHHGDTSRVVDTFYVSSLPSDAASRTAHFSCSLRGISSLGSVDDHHRAQMRLNGRTIADQMFLNYDYATLPTGIPLSDLRIGLNTLEIVSVGTFDDLDAFYLDYWDLAYDDALTPSADTAIANGQWRFTATGLATVFQLGLVSSDAPHLYDLTEGARILGNSGAFLDSSNTQSILYAAATPASFLKCDAISTWNIGGGPGWSILNSATQVDYLVITHPDFATQAGKLAVRRASAGLKTKVVTTDEVYNAFDYGSDEPEALRRYLSYAYYHYQQTPPVSLVTLVGDASWDPKMNMNNVLHAQGDRSNQRSFIPSYGWPVSDFYYTLVDTALDLSTIMPGMVIARIPIATAAEGDEYISKLIEYEDNAPADWNRRWLFIAGGDVGSQHAEFLAESHLYLDSGNGGVAMAHPPTDLNGTIIERKDFTQTDPSQIGAIEDAIRAGQSLMYFAGHGATFITDVILPDAGELHNSGLYPLLVTLSCRTGAFAEYNSVTLNESYIRANRGGSVQAYGTTGFGEPVYDFTLTRKLFQLMRSASFDSTADSMRPHHLNMAILMTIAKLFTSDSAVSIGFASQNSRLQYAMLGDVATGYALRPQPEFSVHQNDITVYAGDKVPRTFFSVGDSAITVSANIRNFGYHAGRPFVVRFEDKGPNNLNVFDSVIVRQLVDSTSVSVRFPLTSLSIGQHTITVTVDPDHRFPQSDTMDDEASVRIQVNGLSATPFYPYEGSRGFCDADQSHAKFIVLLPQGSNPSDQVEFQLDTTNQFVSPILTKQATAGTSYYVRLDAAIPLAPVPLSQVYWWRTRIHRSTGEYSPWEYASFGTAPASKSEMCYSSTEQLSSAIVSGLGVDANGSLSLPQQDSIRYLIHSHSNHDTSKINLVSQVFINDKAIVLFSAQGYAVARLTADGSSIDTVFEFPIDFNRLGDTAYTRPIRESFIATIASIPDNIRAIVFTNIQPAWPGITDDPGVTKAMQSLGSKAGFNNIGFFQSYAMIGMKGQAPGTAKEVFASLGSGGALLYDTIITFGTSGTAETPSTAVASHYGQFHWSGRAPTGGSDIRFSILGSRRDGTGVDEVDTLRASQGTALDLTRIDPRRYDRLAIRAAFTRASSATISPSVSSMELEYDAAPEFAFTQDSLSVTPRVTSEGGPVVVHYGIQTLTCASADSVFVPLLRQVSGKSDTVAYHLVRHIDGDSNITLSDTLQTFNQQGTARLTAVVNPNEAQNEQLLFNNSITGSYSIGRDTTAPYTEILLDERRIPTCGYVSAASHLTVNLYSSNVLRDTVSNSIIAEILPEDRPNEIVDVSASQPHGYTVEFIPSPTGKLQATLRLTPPKPWTVGRWDVTAFVRDASGNTDTIHQCFTVSATNGIEHVMNYPNPFKDKTDFSFVLRSDAQADVKVIVYTIAGRKIRTLIPTNLRAGLNWVEWDGRDENGNDVGNGTYLYRLTINGKNPDGSDVTDGLTQSAVRSR